MADKMTLEQALAEMLSCRGCDPDYVNEITRRTFDRWTDAIDAHLAAMSEPVAEVIAQDLAHHGSPRAIRDKSDLLRPGTGLYVAPPASGDWDKVREVIHRLRGYQREWLGGCAEQLTAALPESQP